MRYIQRRHAVTSMRAAILGVALAALASQAGAQAEPVSTALTPLAEAQGRCTDMTTTPEARIAACTTVLRARPTSADAYGQRGVAHAARGDFTAALADHNRALALRVSPADLMNRASVLMAKGDYAAAIADTDRAASIDPTNPVYENSRCWKRAVAGVDLETALTACERALALFPDDPNPHDSRGLIYLKMGKFAEALVDYDAAAKLVAGKNNPNEASFLFGRGLALLRLGREAEGEADIDAALARQRNISAIYAVNGLTR